jgi:hypothetical protein
MNKEMMALESKSDMNNEIELIEYEDNDQEILGTMDRISKLIDS